MDCATVAMFPRQTTIVAPTQNWPESILFSLLENLHLYILQNGLTHVHSSLHLAIWVSRVGLRLKFWRRDRYNTTQNTVHSMDAYVYMDHSTINKKPHYTYVDMVQVPENTSHSKRVSAKYVQGHHNRHTEHCIYL